MGQAGLPKMHLVVDQTRQKVFPFSVYDLCLRGVYLPPDLFDAVVVNQQVPCSYCSLIDKVNVLYEVFHAQIS